MHEPPPDRTRHFRHVASWEAAEALLAFVPRRPSLAAVRAPSLAIHVRDHRARELPVDARTLEAHYDGFVVSQAFRGAGEAARLALEVRYGAAGRPVRIATHEGRAYDLGPEVAAGDVDGRAPAVVTWHDDGMHYLVASATLSTEQLEEVAASLYR